MLKASNLSAPILPPKSWAVHRQCIKVLQYSTFPQQLVQPSVIIFQATVLKACYFLNYFVHICLLPTVQACQKFTVVEHGKWIIGARGWWQSLDVKCTTDNHLLLKIQKAWGTKNGPSVSQQCCLLFIQTQGTAESKAGTKMYGVWTSGQRSSAIYLSALFQE